MRRAASPLLLSCMILMLPAGALAQEDGGAAAPGTGPAAGPDGTARAEGDQAPGSTLGGSRPGQHPTPGAYGALGWSRPDSEQKGSPAGATTDEQQPGSAAQPATPLDEAPLGWSRAPGLYGSAGPLRLRAASSLPVGHIGLSFWGQFLTMSDMIVVGDDVTRTRGAFAASYAPLEYLETSLAMRWSSSSSNMTSPSLVQSQGELQLGLKGFAPIPDAPGLSAGGYLTADLLTAEGDVFWSGDATTVRLGGLASWDVFRVAPDAPLRAHVNLGYSFENSDSVSERRLRPVETFAHEAMAFDTLDFGLGLEALLDYAAPFLEWNLRVPVATRTDTDDVCVVQEKCPGNEGFGSYPHWLTLGVRVEPWAGLHLSAALDLGLTRTVVSGIPAVPPYNILFGVSYGLNPFPKVVEKERIVYKEAPEPPGGKVRGRVVDRITRQPIPTAIIRFPGTSRTAQAAGEDGLFESYSFEPQKVRIEIDGGSTYKSKAFLVDVKEGGVEYTFPLEPASREVQVEGRVHDLDDMPVPGAQVTVVGREGLVTTNPGTGGFNLTLPPGKHRIRSTATGHLARERDVEARAGERLVLDFLLRPKENVVVVFKKKKLELKRPIHFALGRATIQPDSFFILDQVIDKIVEHDVKRLRIEGHTDNKGNDAANLKLSQERADAVKAYLVSQGIDPGRLEAVGFGESRPVASNRTARGQAANRRVEFHVLDEGTP